MTRNSVDLSILPFRQEIVDALIDHPLVIVTGETGCGKSTQISQFLLDSPKFRAAVRRQLKGEEQQEEENGHDEETEELFPIAITQPRRVAAMSVARRVSEERSCQLGDEVGFKIRFRDCSCDYTEIKYLTDGCLLRELVADGNPLKYRVIILDEAHERSLHTDILFGIVKAFLKDKQNAGFKAVITSAMLDVDALKAFFTMQRSASDVLTPPHIHIPTRVHPVATHYCPLPKDKKQPAAASVSSSKTRVEAVVNAAIRLHVQTQHEDAEALDAVTKQQGEAAAAPRDDSSVSLDVLPAVPHILAFLTGQAECENAVTLTYEKLEQLRRDGAEVGDAVILPLYGALPSDAQQLVFQTVDPDCRKIVYATNVAETSLTIDGVGYVIDSGYCKQKSVNPKTGISSLQVSHVSKVQAAQRGGRAGRTRQGDCFRIYGEEEFNAFPVQAVPEIQRVNLAWTVLQLKALGISDILRFDFFERPSTDLLVLAMKELFLIGALNESSDLLPMGTELVHLPVEPGMARTLVEAHALGVGSDACAMVACMSSDQIFHRPRKGNPDVMEQANAAFERFREPTSDHFTMLNMYQEWKSRGGAEFGRRGGDEDREANFVEDSGPSSAAVSSGRGGGGASSRVGMWARRNFLRHRALIQAREIEQQLRKYLGMLALPPPQKSTPSRWSSEWKQRLLASLAAGHFYKTARPAFGARAWVTSMDGILVRPDTESVMAENAVGGEWFIYTELSSATAKDGFGLMHLVSVIDPKIVEHLLPRIQKVDLQMLTGCRKRPTPEPEEVAPASKNLEAEEKRQTARMRFLERKAAKQQ